MQKERKRVLRPPSGGVVRPHLLVCTNDNQKMATVRNDACRVEPRYTLPLNGSLFKFAPQYSQNSFLSDKIWTLN